MRIARQGANKILVASMARWEEHLRKLVVLEKECLDEIEGARGVVDKRIIGTCTTEAQVGKMRR